MAFQQTSYIGSGSYSAQKDRAIMMEFLRTEGVLRSTDGLVTQRGGGPNQSVDVAVGYFFVQGDDELFQGMYASYNDAIINKSYGVGFTPTTYPRVDSIVARFYDSESGIVGTPQDQMFIDILMGAETNGASTSNIVGAATLPPTAALLAYAVIPVGVGSVLNGYIVDKRRLSQPKIYGEDGNVYRLGIDASGLLGTEIVV